MLRLRLLWTKSRGIWGQMTMAIIVSKDGKRAEKVEPSSFHDEAHLQAYIVDHPEALPLCEIDDNVRLLVLAREFSTNSGSIDAVGIDAEGQIYVIETKLYKNPDKRLVLAQLLDYGAALWRHYSDFGSFVTRLEQAAHGEFGCSLNEKLSEFFGVDENGVTQLLEQVHECLNAGGLRFVVLMDHLDDRLKDLILFVNQNSQFDMYAVELEYYSYEGYEILIPRLYGAEVKKAPAASRKKWDEASFFEDASNKLNREGLDPLRRLFRFSRGRFDELSWGTGKHNGSFSPKLAKISAKSI